jgi:hypothetical protein
VRKLTFAVTTLLVACSESSAPPKPLPVLSALRIVSGNAQHGTVGAALPNAIVVEALDQNGAPMADQSVTFTAESGAGSPSAASVTTASNGQAGTTWTLGTVADTQKMRAAAGAHVDSLIAIGTAGAPDTVRKIVGDQQTGAAGQALPESLSVAVHDRYGNPVAGAAVTWAISAGAGSVSPTTSMTNVAGLATTHWTLGSKGAQNVTATVANLPAIGFQAVIVTPHVHIVPRTATVHSLQLAYPLTASVTDSAGNVISGATLTWSTLDPSLVSVAGNGNAARVTSLANGMARVVAQSLGAVDTATITIQQVVGSITISNSVLNIVPGVPFALSIVASDSNGVPLVNQNVTYAITSLNPTFVSVTSTGVVQGLAYGAAEITVGLPGAVSYLPSPNASAIVSVVHQPASQVVFTQLAGSAWHMCALTSGQEVYCWGDNGQGESADPIYPVNPNSPSFGPAPVPMPTGNGLLATMVTVDYQTTCAITTSASTDCWGYVTGIGTSPSPTAVSGAPAFTTISLNSGTGCGLTASGAAYCWGDNSEGQFGNGTLTSSASPVPVGGGYTFTSIAVGVDAVCGLLQSGAAYCWGAAGYGQLGTGVDPSGYPTCTVSTCTTTPVPVAGSLNFSMISAGGSHVCGVVTSGSVYCWGFNGDGELGIGNFTGPTSQCPGTGEYPYPGACSLTPIQVSGTLHATALSAGSASTCALDAGGQAWCWGNRTNTTPTEVPGGHVFSSIASDASGACALTAAAQIFCWGGIESSDPNSSGLGIAYGLTPILVPHPAGP